jgi:hypothetical protein
LSENDDGWTRAYAKQALSDLDAREALVSAGCHKCHRLHFLQMAAEKVCKAYLVKTNGHDHLKKTHACVKNVLPQLARSFFSNTNQNSAAKINRVKAVKRFAAEIEVLAPACAEGGREDNCEYPWEELTGDVRVPCEFGFPNIDDSSRDIVPLITLIRNASESYSS